MRSRLPLALALALAACEPLSVTRDGRDDAVRYQLPPGAIAILDHADELVLFALGDRDDEGAEGERFGDRPVLGRVELAEHDRRYVASALYRGIHRAHGQALCFVPHHGIRARRGDEVIELLVCLSCFQMAFVGEEGPNIAIASDELWHLFGSFFEAHARLRFVDGDRDHPFGRWERLEHGSH